MPLAYNNQTKAMENVPGEHLADAFLSGSHSLPSDKPVTIADRSGKLFDIDPKDAYNAVTQHGYRFAGDNEIQEADNQQTYGEGLGNAAKAFGAGALRSATFGASDQFLTKTGAVSPETLHNLSKYNPGSTFAGEATGILGSFAAPEIEGAGALLNPVRAAAKLGEGIEGAAAGALGAGTAESAAGNILRSGAAKFAGSAAEGAAYGAGQSVSEDALGDPSLNAQKVISNIGMGAVLGGTVGTALGMVLPKPTKFISEVDKPLLEAGDLGAAVRASDSISPEQKKTVLEHLSDVGKLKDNAEEIRSAADELGAPLVPGQLSKSQVVQDTASGLINGVPTAPTRAIQKTFQQGVDTVNKVVSDTLGGAQAGMTEREAGDALKSEFTKKIQEAQEPIKKAYAAVGSDLATIPVPEDAISRAQQRLSNIEGIGLRPRSDVARFVKGVSEDLSNVKTAADLDRFMSGVSKETANNLNFRYIGGQIRDALNDLHEEIVSAHAENMLAPLPEAKAAIAEMRALRAEGKARYKSLMEQGTFIANALGKNKVYGPQHLLDIIEDAPGEKLARAFFRKSDSAAFEELKARFPEAYEIARNLERSKIFNKSLKDGEFVASKAIKEINALPKELRNSLFTEQELRKIKASDTWLSALPKDANPSGTSHMSALRAFFSGHENVFGIPGSGIALANGRDYAMLKFVQAAEHSATADATTKALSAIERASQKTTARIATSSKALFKYSAQGAPGIATEISRKDSGDRNIDRESSEKQYFKRADKLSELAANPDKLLNTLDTATQPVFPHAPKIAAGFHQTAVSAVSFLASKRPNPGVQLPLSPKYRPSMSEISDFNHYYDMVENPLKAMDELKAGNLQPSTIETLQTVYPELYGEMKSSIIHEITKRDNKVPYRQRVLLSMFLGNDLDESLLQQNMLANQASIQGPTQQAANQPQQGPKPNQKGLAAIDRSGQVTTAMQKTSQREA
jgi:hypothetical protein